MADQKFEEFEKMFSVHTSYGFNEICSESRSVFKIAN